VPFSQAAVSSGSAALSGDTQHGVMDGGRAEPLTAPSAATAL